MPDERDPDEDEGPGSPPPSPPEEERDDGTPRTPAEWVRPYFTDPALWPVLIVAAVTLFSLGGALLVLGVAERRVPAAGGLLILLWMSVDASLRERRRSGFGVVTGSIVACWVGSALAALGLVHTGMF